LVSEEQGKLEDANRVIRIRKSKKDRQCNDRKKKTNKDAKQYTKT